MRNFLNGFLIGAIAAECLLASGYMFYGFDVPDKGKYYLSDVLGNVIGIESSIVTALSLAVMYARGSTKWLFSIPVLISPFVCVIAYEIVVDPTAHNLWPISLVFLIMYSLIMHVPSLILMCVIHRPRNHKDKILSSNGNPTS